MAIGIDSSDSQERTNIGFNSLQLQLRHQFCSISWHKFPERKLIEMVLGFVLMFADRLVTYHPMPFLFVVSLPGVSTTKTMEHELA